MNQWTQESIFCFFIEYIAIVHEPAAELRGIKYKKDSLRFPSPQRGEGKGEGADSGEKKC